MKPTEGSRACRSRAMLGMVVALAALGVLSGCGNRQAGNDTQVAARINDEDVSVHQVQHVLQEQPRLMAEYGEAAPRKALDALVEQELAAQAAHDAGMQSDPSVIQALEAARRETLARAFQDRLARQAIQPDADTIDRYYDDHADRFAHRRLYSLQEFSIEANARQRETVRALAQASATLAELQQGLSGNKLRYSTRPLMLATEAIPTPLRAEVQALQVGRALMVERPRGMQLLYLVAVQDFRLDRNAARPIIEAELLAQSRRERVEQGMKPLRQAARIDLMGKFAQAESPSAAASSP